MNVLIWNAEFIRLPSKCSIWIVRILKHQSWKIFRVYQHKRVPKKMHSPSPISCSPSPIIPYQLPIGTVYWRPLPACLWSTLNGQRLRIAHRSLSYVEILSRDDWRHPESTEAWHHEIERAVEQKLSGWAVEVMLHIVTDTSLKRSRT